MPETELILRKQVYSKMEIAKVQIKLLLSNLSIGKRCLICVTAVHCIERINLSIYHLGLSFGNFLVIVAEQLG